MHKFIKVSLTNVRFLFDGERIMESQTPGEVSFKTFF